MGTNYYIRTTGCEKQCEHCEQADRIHLGKSSIGWKFGFYAPSDWPREEAYTRWSEQIDVHLRSGGHIEDEYGRRHTKEELLSLIAVKQQHHSHLDPRPEERAAWADRNMADLYDRLLKSYFDCDGYDFSDREFS